MTTHDDAGSLGRMRVVRSRGALSGLLLVALGIWGIFIPFVGPYFNYAYTPDTTWTWTAGRFWLEVLPGVVAVLAGLLLATTANRGVGVLAGYLASAAGAWFVVGPVLGQLWNGAEGAAGTPVGGTVARVVENIGFFSGLGVAIVFFGAQALGRFTVRSVRDVEAARRHRAAEEPQERVVERPVPTPMPVERQPAEPRRVEQPVERTVAEPRTVERTTVERTPVEPTRVQAPVERTREERPDAERVEPGHVAGEPDGGDGSRRI